MCYEKNVFIADTQDVGLTKAKNSSFSTQLHQTSLSFGTKPLSITILSPLGRFRETLGLFWSKGFKLNLLIALSDHKKPESWLKSVRVLIKRFGSSPNLVKGMNATTRNKLFLSWFLRI